MGLSRRTFTKKFKEAAVRRLELGAGIAEVARACEVNPNVLHRWRRELRDYGAKAFRGNGLVMEYIEGLSFAKNAPGSITLCCNAFITVMQAAEVRDLNDPANARDLPSVRTLLVES